MREAWGRYSPAEVVLVGRTPYPEPPADIRRGVYSPPCENCLRKPPAVAGGQPATTRDATALHRDLDKAFHQQIAQEIVRAEQQAAEKRAKRKKRAAQTA